MPLPERSVIQIMNSSAARFVLALLVLMILPTCILALVLLSGAVAAVVIAGSLLLALIMFTVFLRTMVRPLQTLTDVVSRLADGDFSARAKVSTAGEVGDLAAGVNQVLDQIAEPSRIREEQDRITAQIDRLLVELGGLAGGDLSVEAGFTDGPLGSISDPLNDIIRQLRALVAKVAESTDAVDAVSAEVSQSSTELMNNSENQIKHIDSAVSVLNSLATLSSRVSEDAHASNDVTGEARAHAESGTLAVRETTEVMRHIQREVQEATGIVTRLGESSEEIGLIVQLIAQIARQTNTLALNASIQAATAGEHGRGFAVVADEVRKLAERSSAAAKQMSGLVSSIQTETADAMAAMDSATQQVAGGAETSDRAGTELEQIGADMTRLSGLIERVVSGAEEQARSATDSAGTMSDLSEKMKNAATGTRRAASSAESLAGPVERLRQSVAIFTLPSDGNRSWTGMSTTSGDD